jgi:hypothetical protein
MPLSIEANPELIAAIDAFNFSEERLSSKTTGAISLQDLARIGRQGSPFCLLAVG